MVTTTSKEMISSLSSAVNLYANDFSEYEKKILEAYSYSPITAIYFDRKKFQTPFKMQSKLM